MWSIYILNSHYVMLKSLLQKLLLYTLFNDVTLCRMATPKRGKNFDQEKLQILERYHSKGMTGTGKKNKKDIENASKETGLTPTQVEVSYSLFVVICCTFTKTC